MPNANYPKTHPDKKLKCGSCQWFLSGYNGNNCRRVREVEADTQACVEFTAFLKDPFHALSQDKYILSLKEALKAARFRLSDDVVEELKGYILDQDFNDYRIGTDRDLQRLHESLLLIIQYQARVSQIFTMIIDTKHELEKIQRHFLMWLSSKYTVYKDLKNESLRKAACDRILPEIIPIQQNIDKVYSLAKYADETLEKNDWRIRAILGSADKHKFIERDVRRY